MYALVLYYNTRTVTQIYNAELDYYKNYLQFKFLYPKIKYYDMYIL